MSTFDGIIEEIPKISIDEFTGNNLKSDIFFLSHCHSDHMKGMNNFKFLDVLRKENTYLYASPISIKILVKQIPCLPTEKLLCLDMFRPISVKIPTTDEYITVISIPAGHCPGSVMLFFETKTKTVLYTGDFRINPDDVFKIKQFLTDDKKLRKIDHIYLDTTFFSKQYRWFPRRDAVSKDLIRLIEEWIKNDKSKHVNLMLSSYYGYEDVFLEIWTKLKKHIHVCPKMFNLYKYIQKINEAFQTNSTNVQIHAFCCGYQSFCNNYMDPKNLRTIKLSAMSWTSESLESIEKANEFSSYHVTNENQFSLCYSTHCSYNEIKTFLKHLKPEKISPNVVPSDEIEKQKLFKLINDFLPSKQTHKEQQSEKIFLGDSSPIKCKKLKLQ